MSIVNAFKNVGRMLATEARETRRPVAALWLEVAEFCLRTRLGPRYFVVAGMARPDFPRHERWHHISDAQFHRAVDILNPPAYRKLTQSKLAEKGLYELLEIPSPRMLAHYHPETGYAREFGALCSPEALDAWLLTQVGRRLCVKPLEGWGGRGVLAGDVELDRNGAAMVGILHSSERIAARELVDRYAGNGGMSNFLVEAYLRQSVEFSRFNSSSLNSIRIWVIQQRGEVRVLGAYLRVGRAGALVDNGSAGGIMFPIDCRDGTLLPGLLKSTPHRGDIITHLDSGETIAGGRLPDWDLIGDFACEALRKLPHTRFAGLDVAVSHGGEPMLIECNPVPDKDGAAHARIPSIELKRAARLQRKESEQ
ncbi:sugar-transfer associated ATP-grasp domain-containing protein [Parahaliea mediterranea]|uniref:Alpha-L-glutamate ligase-related protein ATP-grasp domain-containing protein n=1 Tax=Parahaliea mediterranea TaxID=651086 RepID=A0A939IME5_9GAMM|nr:sugar-transfer associated ATP-grasp domain-containing protein [Parahaliea mediterranea]MBN7797430.1 hypothetical protein [Parahaliea mediterranea]